MEETATQQPVAEATNAVLPTGTEESESAAQLAQPTESNVMDDVIRGMVQGRSPLNLGAVVPTSELNSDPSAQPAPESSGDVNPDVAQTAGKPPRRLSKVENEQRIATLEAENTRLQQAMNELTPPVPDASEEARAARLATEQRYRTLLTKSEYDTDWADGDFDWLREEKHRRSLVPDLQQHYETVLEADRAAVADTLTQEREAFISNFGNDMASTFTLPGLTEQTVAALKASPRFSEHVLIHRQAERAAVLAEIGDDNARLRAENGELRRQALGAAPAPITGGRPSGGATGFDMDSFIRQSMGNRIG